MAKDYRGIEEIAEKTQARADRIRAAKPAEAEAEDITAASLRLMAADMYEREQTDLRAIAANGTVLSGLPAAPAYGDFRAYLRSGEIQNASMSTTDANGGYLVPEPAHAVLIEKARAVDPILSRAHRFDLSAGDTSMTLPYKSTHGVVTTATETGTRSEQNGPGLTSDVLTCYDYYTDQRATQTLVDSIPGFEDMLLGWIYEDLYSQFSVDLATGTGPGVTAGLFAATSVYTTKLSGSAGVLVNQNFLTLATALHPRYSANAAWLMNGTTLGVVSAMAHPASTATQPLVDWTSGAPRIMGYPVLRCDAAPDIGAANYPVAFGDLEAGYAIGEHRTPSVLRDPFTATPKVRYYGLARLGGCPWNPEAVILLKSNNA